MSLLLSIQEQEGLWGGEGDGTLAGGLWGLPYQGEVSWVLPHESYGERDPDVR